MGFGVGVYQKTFSFSQQICTQAAHLVCLLIRIHFLSFRLWDTGKDKFVINKCQERNEYKISNYPTNVKVSVY